MKYFRSNSDVMGYGDEIMATAELSRIKQEYPDAKVVIGDGVREYWSEVFAGNPNLSKLCELKPGDRVIWLNNYRGCRPYIDYSRSDMDYRISFKPYRPRPGSLYLSAAERARAAEYLEQQLPKDKPWIFIEPNVDFGQPKDWGFQRWQQLVDDLADEAHFVQPIYAGAKALNNVLSAPSENFRSGCALLGCCCLHTGPEGGLHHAAAALGIPAVVVIGGRVHPDLIGYDFHTYFYVADAESPCGMIAPCEHCARCMDQIPVASVVAAIRERLSKVCA